MSTVQDMTIIFVATIAFTAVLAAARAAEVWREAPASIRPPGASAFDLARDRLQSGDITYEEFLELCRMIGE